MTRGRRNRFHRQCFRHGGHKPRSGVSCNPRSPRSRTLRIEPHACLSQHGQAREHRPPHACAYNVSVTAWPIPPPTNMVRPPYAVPIADRAKPNACLTVVKVVSIALFMCPTMLCEMLLVILCMPLWYVWPTAFQTVIRACKTLFVILFTHMFSVFAHSEIIMSFGGMDGQCVDAEQFVQRDALGRVVGLNLPQTGIWVGNHQIYTDWVYMWYVLSLIQVSFSLCGPRRKLLYCTERVPPQYPTPGLLYENFPIPFPLPELE